MAKFATDIDSAMALLKGEGGSTDTESAQDNSETAGADTDKVGETDTAIIDVVKSEDDMAQLIQADDFMLSLARNQDANVELLAKAVGNNMSATAALGDVMKAQNEQIEKLAVAVEALGSTPQPRRAVLNKSEAERAVDATIPAPADEAQSDPLGGAKLTKADVVRVLVEGSKEDSCTNDDIMKAESALGGGNSMKVIELGDFVNSLSPGGQKIVKSLVESQQL